tara:strand:- start:1235 stop:2536 length:1302 start_codon:yes stop_codon:yes gene_type:complete
MKINNSFFKYACTKCGACEGIYPDKIYYDKKNETFISNVKFNYKEMKKFRNFCPGMGINFKKNLSEKKYVNKLIGNNLGFFVGYSNNNNIRLNSASGGTLTEINIYLLKNNYVDFVIMPTKNIDNISYDFKFLNKKSLITKNSQSIYYKIPLRDTVEKIKKLRKRVALVALPDQIYAVKKITENDSELKKYIKFTYGPMVGINMEKNSIEGIRKVYNIKNSSKLKFLKWRDGKWPGYLNVKFEKYKRIKIKKFYYNFLLPFYCTYESIFSADFYNEFADFSVGDAWSPKYENSSSEGISIISVKNKKSLKLIKKLKKEKIIHLEKIGDKEAIKMHAHMADFKKRGSYYRRKIFTFFGKSAPDHQTYFEKFYFKRFIVELIILLFILTLKTNLGKYILNIASPNFLGWVFTKLRYAWKKITINIKRDKLLDGIK